MASSKRYSSFMIDDILDRTHQDYYCSNSPHSYTDPSSPTPAFDRNSENLRPTSGQEKEFRYLSSNSLPIINSNSTIPEQFHRFSLENFILRQLLLKRKVIAQAKSRRGGQIRFNYQQTVELEEEFSRCKYLLPVDRKLLAMKLQLTERQVKTWFQNRRAKWRRIKEASFNRNPRIHRDFSSENRDHCNELAIMSNHPSGDSRNKALS